MRMVVSDADWLKCAQITTEKCSLLLYLSLHIKCQIGIADSSSQDKEVGYKYKNKTCEPTI